MKAIIFDMDGTLADVRDIQHHLTGDVKDFDLYHTLSVDVPPVDRMLETIHESWCAGYGILIVTARKAKYRGETEAFLAKHGIRFDILFMRDNDDTRSDYELKKDILKSIRELDYDVEFAYDDNPEIIKLWQEAGIETVHVTGFGFDYDILQS